MKIRYIFIALLVISGLLFRRSVLAATYGGLGLFPAYSDPQNPMSESWFIYNLVAGEEKKDTLLIRNSSDQTLTAKIYSADGTTTADGSFTLEGDKEKVDGLGSWITLPTNTVTVGPREERKMDFTIKIPKGTAVGDHTGGILLENANVNKGKGVNVVTRVGVRIYETVPGQLIRKLKITELSWKLLNDKINFYFGFENQGNTQLTPTGKIYFENSLFGGKSDYDVNLGTVLQGRPTRVPIVWLNTPLIGQVKARAVIKYGEGPNDRMEREVSFSYVTKKAKIIAVIAVILVALMFVMPGMMKKRKK